MLIWLCGVFENSGRGWVLVCASHTNFQSCDLHKHSKKSHGACGSKGLQPDATVTLELQLLILLPHKSPFGPRICSIGQSLIFQFLAEVLFRRRPISDANSLILRLHQTPGNARIIYWIFSDVFANEQKQAKS